MNDELKNKLAGLLDNETIVSNKELLDTISESITMINEIDETFKQKDQEIQSLKEKNLEVLTDYAQLFKASTFKVDAKTKIEQESPRPKTLDDVFEIELKKLKEAKNNL